MSRGQQPASSSSSSSRRSLFFVRVDLGNSSARRRIVSSSRDDDEVDDDEEEEEDEESSDLFFPFSTGSACAKTEGRLRLFREDDDGDGETSASSSRCSKLVLVPFIPSSFSVADLCEFFAPVRANVRELRVVVPKGGGGGGEQQQQQQQQQQREEEEEKKKSNKGFYFAAILAFDDEENAKMFSSNFHGQPFSSLNDEEICRCVFVKSVEFGKERGDGADEEKEEGVDGGTELPANCPVCLDRLDGEVSGILTTSCGHHFHADCMSGVSGSVCPVCRFAMDATAKREAKCERCECQNGSLWTCLICGVVGCGRYENRHAVAHWTETGHCYSLEIGSGRVWDYSRDQFVHRLIQGKHGLVELTPDEKGRRSHAIDPSTRAVGRRVEGPGGGEGGYAYGHPDGDDLEDGDDPELTEALVASKLDAVANEYDQLLASQLDQQRKHYERLLMDAASDKSEMMTKVEIIAEQATKLRLLNRRADHAEKEVKRLEEENVFLKQLNEQMLRDAGEMRETKMTSSTKEKEKIASLEEKVRELEGMNRDLMFFLESKETIQKSKGSELDARFGKIELEEKEMQEEPTLVRGKVSTKDRLRAKLKERNKK